jgi:hypothetical protein
LYTAPAVLLEAAPKSSNSKTFLFEKYRYLPVSAHKEALQVVLPGGLIAVSKLKETTIPLSYSLQNHAIVMLSRNEVDKQVPKGGVWYTPTASSAKSSGR